MFLLNKFKKKNIVVAHINYNLRPEAIFETLLLINFCQKNNLTLKILSFDSFRVKGNLQNQLRIARYQFFKEIYQQFSCTKLLTAHHRDDFIETILMQKSKKKTVSYWGIRVTNQIFGMKIWRPLLFLYTKESIIRKCRKKSIPFLDDKSNFETKYERNQVRFYLQKKSSFVRFLLFLCYFLLNFYKNLSFLQERWILSRWKRAEFSVNFFRKIRKKNNIVYLYVNQNFKNIKLSKSKINSIADFICSKSTKSQFLLKKNNYIVKKKWKIIAKPDYDCQNGEIS